MRSFQLQQRRPEENLRSTQVRPPTFIARASMSWLFEGIISNGPGQASMATEPATGRAAGAGGWPLRPRRVVGRRRRIAADQPRVAGQRQVLPSRYVIDGWWKCVDAVIGLRRGLAPIPTKFFIGGGMRRAAMSAGHGVARWSAVSAAPRAYPAITPRAISARNKLAERFAAVCRWIALADARLAARGYLPTHYRLRGFSPAAVCSLRYAQIPAAARARIVRVPGAGFLLRAGLRLAPRRAAAC